MQSAVGDISWSTFSSTGFTAATAEGKIFVYDLNVDKYSPLCEQIIVQKKKTKLSHIDFNNIHPIVVGGDSKGHCTVLKLSPNLRKRPPRSKKDPRPMPIDPKQEYDKIQAIQNIGKWLWYNKPTHFTYAGRPRCKSLWVYQKKTISWKKNTDILRAASVPE